MWGSGRIVPSRADQGLDSVLFKHRSATGWQLFCTPHWLHLALKAVTESGFSGIILSECTTCGTLHRERSVNSASDAHCGDKAAQMIARSLCSEVNQLTSLDVQYKLLGEQAGVAIAKALQSKHCKLTHLMISYLCLTSKAGMAFATALQSPHCQLEYLDLSFVWGASFMGVWGGLREAAGLAVARSLSSKHCKLTNIKLAILPQARDRQQGLEAGVRTESVLLCLKVLYFEPRLTSQWTWNTSRIWTWSTTVVSLSFGQRRNVRNAV